MSMEMLGWDPGLDGLAGNDHVRSYVATHYRHAKEVQRVHGIAPLISLAQAALESDWGRSKIAREANNFFGLTVGGPGAKTPYYKPGNVYNASTGLRFRKYASDQDGWLDYGHFIMHFKSYVALRPYIADFNAFTTAVAKSKYISEENGDNRAGYMRGMAARAKAILEATGGRAPAPIAEDSGSSSAFPLLMIGAGVGLILWGME